MAPTLTPILAQTLTATLVASLAPSLTPTRTRPSPDRVQGFVHKLFCQKWHRFGAAIHYTKLLAHLSYLALLILITFGLKVRVRDRDRDRVRVRFKLPRTLHPDQLRPRGAQP